MTYLRDSILATLVYYDIFDFPLTAFEVYKHLINPGRLKKLSRPVKDIPISKIEKELDKLKRISLIGSTNGFYFLSGREHLYDLRIKKQKIASRKWKKFLKISKWFSTVPYLRSVFASGSIALDNTDKESDFDVLIIVKSGRLYTCRFILSLLTSLFRSRRRWCDVVAPDKFCFNHYLSENNLSIQYESLYGAQTYVNLRPVLTNHEIFLNFFNSNVWLNKYVFGFKIRSEDSRTAKTNKVFSSVARILERILDLKIGDFLELILRKYQQRRIRLNPLTYAEGGRVIFNNYELEFHPKSFEAFLVDKYNSELTKFGIVPYVKEKDSGLVGR